MSCPKAHSRTWWLFHTSSPKAQSGNDTNIRIVTENLPITKFLSVKNKKKKKSFCFFYDGRNLDGVVWTRKSTLLSVIDLLGLYIDEVANSS